MAALLQAATQWPKRPLQGEEAMPQGTPCRAIAIGACLWVACAQAQERVPAALAPVHATVSTPTITNATASALAQEPPPAAARRAEGAPAAVDAPAPAGDAAELGDFERLVAQTAGERLPLYGHGLFHRAPSTFAPVENVPVTAEYVVGPGDELVIRAWGQIDVDYRALVDRNGAIGIPRVGIVPVAGVRLDQLTSHVRAAIGRNFRNFEVVVSLGRLRSVQVFVVGHARRPGAYTVSSLSTLLNAVFAVGGPAPTGSMRAIELKRGSTLVTRFDLYDVLLRGDTSRDVPLLAGDVIYFPPVGPLAAVAGAVKAPAIFELKSPSDVATLLELAGGLTTTAQTRLASLERIHERDARVVDQFALDASGLARPVRDGDLLSVLNISPRFRNAVTLRGHVATPLRHPYREGMRVRDLIPEKEALIRPDFYERKNLAVRVEAVKQGEVVAGIRRLADEINWDYAVIERQDAADLGSRLIPFQLGRAVLDGDAAQNLPLLPGDIVTIFSKSDISTPAARRPAVVRLEGEFNFAGVYQAAPGETLRQLVTRAGGLTPNAYLFGAELTRESTRRNQEERLRQALDQLEQDLQRASASRAQNVASPEDAASLKAEADAQRALLSRLRTLKPGGRIVLHLPERPTLAEVPDLPLEDGDRFFVPHNPAQVSVFGTVFNESSFLYEPHSTVADYLAQAGGPRKEADRGSMYILRANGSVVSARQNGFLVASLAGERVMPGDAIVVPEDFTRTTWAKDLKDWTQIFYQFGLGAAALKVIKD